MSREEKYQRINASIIRRQSVFGTHLIKKIESVTPEPLTYEL